MLPQPVERDFLVFKEADRNVRLAHVDEEGRHHSAERVPHKQSDGRHHLLPAHELHASLAALRARVFSVDQKWGSVAASEFRHRVNDVEGIFQNRRDVGRPRDLDHAIVTYPNAKLLPHNFACALAHGVTANAVTPVTVVWLSVDKFMSTPLFGGPANRVGPVALRLRLATGLPFRLFTQLYRRGAPNLVGVT